MRIFLTILLILAFINVDGQTLTGQVVDEDGGPIAFATVARFGCGWWWGD